MFEQLLLYENGHDFLDVQYREKYAGTSTNADHYVNVDLNRIYSEHKEKEKCYCPYKYSNKRVVLLFIM